MNTMELQITFDLIRRLHKEGLINTDEYDAFQNVAQYAEDTMDNNLEEYSTGYIDGYMEAQRDLKKIYTDKIDSVLTDCENGYSIDGTKEIVQYSNDYIKGYSKAFDFLKEWINKDSEE